MSIEAACPKCHKRFNIEFAEGEESKILAMSATCDHCGVTKRVSAFRKQLRQQESYTPAWQYAAALAIIVALGVVYVVYAFVSSGGDRINLLQQNVETVPELQDQITVLTDKLAMRDDDIRKLSSSLGVVESELARIQLESSLTTGRRPPLLKPKPATKVSASQKAHNARIKKAADDARKRKEQRAHDEARVKRYLQYIDCSVSVTMVNDKSDWYYPAYIEIAFTNRGNEVLSCVNATVFFLDGAGNRIHSRKFGTRLPKLLPGKTIHVGHRDDTQRKIYERKGIPGSPPRDLAYKNAINPPIEWSGRIEHEIHSVGFRRPSLAPERKD